MTAPLAAESPRVDQRERWVGIIAGLVTLTATSILAVQAQTGGMPPAKEPTPTLRREGTTLQARGRFETTGGRLRFHPDGEAASVLVLENLSAERIETHLRESTGPTLWRVEGTLTEYQGANYLLIGYARRTS